MINFIMIITLVIILLIINTVTIIFVAIFITVFITIMICLSFSGTTHNLWKVSLAFYSSLWAYNGWQSLTNVTEEVKHIKKTLPLALTLSVAMVTGLYLLVNLSYYSVLTTAEVRGFVYLQL